MTSAESRNRQPNTPTGGFTARDLVPAAVFAGLTVLGAAAFLSGVGGDEPLRAWQAFLTNFIFWTGLAAGSVLLSAVLTMTNASWGRPLKRLAEAPGAFLPPAFILFWFLYAGKEHLFPWLHEDLGRKAGWLDIHFLFARDGFALLVLVALAAALIYSSVKPDLEMSASGSLPPGAEIHRKRQGRLAVAYGLLYAFILTLLAFDLIMSLDPHWVSTLFGAYYFMGSFYTGLAAVLILAVIAVKFGGLGDAIRPKQFHDMGKLLFAFCIVTADFFYAQFLVIWYGNLSEETSYVITRVNFAPWNILAWTVLAVAFALPFLVLLNRDIKMKRVPMTILAAVILAGMWLERLLLVAPSLWKAKTLPFGPTEVLITAGFLGLMALCILFFLRRFPMLPVSDPLFRASAGADSPSSHG